MRDLRKIFPRAADWWRRELASHIEFADDDESCWPWKGSHFSNGYGRFTMGNQQHMAHRLTWESASGRDVPKGLVLDHLCANRWCVRPGHLDPVTSAENLRRGNRPHFELRGTVKQYPKIAREPATACNLGHALSGDNVYVSKEGYRRCKTCQKASAKARRAEKRSPRG